MAFRSCCLLGLVLAAAPVSNVAAAGVACPELAPTRLPALSPLMARRVERSVRLAVLRPRQGDVARVVRMIRRADAKSPASAIINYLVAVSCPMLVAQTRGDESAQSQAVNAFAGKVQKAVY